MQDPTPPSDSDTDTDVDDSIVQAVYDIAGKPTPVICPKHFHKPKKLSGSHGLLRKHMQAALDEAWQIYDEHFNLGLLKTQNGRKCWPALTRIAKDHGVPLEMLRQYMNSNCRTYQEDRYDGSSYILTDEEQLELFEWIRLNELANHRRPSVGEICNRANEIIRSSDNPEGRGVFYFVCWSNMYKRYTKYCKRFDTTPSVSVRKTVRKPGRRKRPPEELRKQMQPALDEMWRLYDENPSAVLNNKKAVVQRTADAFGVSYWSLRQHFTNGFRVFPINQRGENKRVLTAEEQRQLFEWLYQQRYSSKVSVKDICAYANQLLSQSSEGHARPTFYHQCWIKIRHAYFVYEQERQTSEAMRCSETLSTD